MKATIAQFPGPMAPSASRRRSRRCNGETVEPFIDTGTELVTADNAAAVPAVPVDAAGGLRRSSSGRRSRGSARRPATRRRHRSVRPCRRQCWRARASMRPRRASPSPPDPGPGEVLVAVRRVGICGTDHHAYSGTQNFFVYPRVLGHELAVEVLGGRTRTVDDGSATAAISAPCCPTCRAAPATACRRGRANCCERIDVLGVTRDGGLRERMVVPARHLFTGPGCTLDQLVLVETLGVGWHAVDRAEPQPDDSVLVLGAGPIGLAVALAARATVDLLVVADIAAERVAFAERIRPSTRSWSTGDFARTTCSDHDRGDAAVASCSTPPVAGLDGVGVRPDRIAGGTLVFVGHTTGSITLRQPALPRPRARPARRRGTRPSPTGPR